MTHLAPAIVDRVLLEVERAADEVVAFTADMIRIPTVNPPGEHYEDCARFIGDTLDRLRLRHRVLRRRGPARAHGPLPAAERGGHARRASSRGPRST